MIKQNHVILTKDLIEFLDGELLGDGCLIGHRISSHYQHRTKHIEYLNWLSNIFNDFGIEMVGRIYKDKGKYTAYSYITRCYAELLNIHKRWYVNGKKSIPNDLSLTPIIVRQWYIGDGSLIRYKLHNSMMINLASNAFTKKENEILISKLEELGLKVTYRKDNSIMISTYSLLDFFSYIGECPKEIKNIYGYKWLTESESKILKEKIELNIKANETYRNKEWLNSQYINKEKSISKIANEFNLCADSIWKGLKKYKIKRRHYYDT